MSRKTPGSSIKIKNSSYSGGRCAPGLSQPDYLTLEQISCSIQELSDNLPGNGKCRVLDIGCGIKPYFSFFDGKISEYVGVDIDGSLKADITADLNEQFLFEDESFDVVLCTQVLEHVRRPHFVVDEIFRVCKKGGIVFASAPFVWEVHNYPDDYWRFTQQGLELLFEKFGRVEVLPCGNSAQGIIQTTNLFFNRTSQKNRLKKLIFTLCNKYLMRIISKSKDNLLPVNYIVKAVK